MLYGLLQASVAGAGNGTSNGKGAAVGEEVRSGKAKSARARSKNAPKRKNGK